MACSVTVAGESYSIADWKRRIEYFRNAPCEVCSIVNHSLWIWSEGLSESNRKKHIAKLRDTLDWNFGNWQEFVSWAEIERRFAATKRGARDIAA